MNAKQVEINELVLDGTQTRVAMSDEAIADYAEAYRDRGEAALPPVHVVRVGGRMRLVDGFHRVAAAREAGLTTLLAVIEDGTEDVCFERALQANKAHGLRRTNADKRRTVELALDHERYRAMPARELARLLGVTHPLVLTVRRELEPDPEPPTSEDDEVDFGLPVADAVVEAVTTEPAVTRDKLGRPIPDIDDLATVVDDFKNHGAFTPIRRALTAAIEAIDEVKQRVPARRLAFCDLDALQTRLQAARSAVSRDIVDPHVWFDQLPAQHWSESKTKAQPRLDRHTGWVPRQVFEHHYPQKVREAMEKASGGAP